MAKTPLISHTVNGYSRYDIPESVAFSASPGILYPVRCDFMNARDVRYVQAGAVIRTNPSILPTFTPFRVSLHRFFVPMQLYHPEMRVNSANFDMQNLTTNVIPAGYYGDNDAIADGDIYRWTPDLVYCSGRSLLAFLGLYTGLRRYVESGNDGARDPFMTRPTTETLELGSVYVNADPVLAYYDIIRSYYSFSQLDTISLAFAAGSENIGTNFGLPLPANGVVDVPTKSKSFLIVGDDNAYYRQGIGKLEPFDELFESSFYPVRGEASGLYYNRMPLICEAIFKSLRYADTVPTRTTVNQICEAWYNTYVTYNVAGSPYSPGPDQSLRNWSCEFVWGGLLPYGVAPAMADRYSRLLGLSNTDSVPLNAIGTVRGLAFAAKLQAYRDLITSGGSRFTDWLMTFFAAKVKHVDRPVLVYSSSFYLNSSPIFSQQGGESLGSYAGVISGQDSFGKKAQRYCFDEPGYLMDIFCIRPQYYWSGIQRDYARYDKMDYFNPIFNEVGFQDVPGVAFGGNNVTGFNYAVRREPCYNEFRASYDRVLGDLALIPGYKYTVKPVLSTWVQQRTNVVLQETANPTQSLQKYLAGVYYVDVAQASSIFASQAEDNFFVNIYYNVTSKSLVSKNFATNLATR